MNQSKLLQLLRTFRKEEWRRFREFLESPYFNKRDDLLRFYGYLNSIAPEMPEKKLEKELVFEKIFPGQKYDDKQLKYTMNYLLKKAEQFLVHQKLEGNPPLRNNILLDTLVNRKLNKHYNGYLGRVTADLDKRKKENSNYYYHKYQLADIANVHYTLQNLRKYDDRLQKVSDSLDEFYFLNKLKYSCEMLNRSKVVEGNYGIHFIEEVISFLSEHSDRKNPLLSVYMEVYFTLVKDHADIHFETIKKLLGIYGDQFPDFEKRVIYLYAINFCGTQIASNHKRTYYVKECLQLYITGIDKEFLLNNGNLSPWTFKNVIRLGLNLKEFDWTEQFIHTHHKKLVPEFQEDALHYNLADLAFKRKKYSEAQYHLLLVQYSDIFYYLGAKEMLLKIYFEEKEVEALFALIASFSIYLRRNKKISDNFKNTYLNFAAILQQILRAKPDRIPSIVERIRKTELLTSRNWLLSICEQ